MIRFAVVVLAGALASLGASGYGADFEAVLLGTGIPLVNPDRAGAATLIIAGETTVLVDTGRGAMGRLAAAGYRFDYGGKSVVISGDTKKVAEIARDAGVKKLVLTHLVPSIPPEEGREQHFIRGMSEVFSGPVVVARDGMRVTP